MKIELSKVKIGRGFLKIAGPDLKIEIRNLIIEEWRENRTVESENRKRFFENSRAKSENRKKKYDNRNSM